MNGELIVVDDLPGEFAERVIEAFHARPGEGFSMALSGGDTARRCYERLAADGADQIDWWQVDIYWSDERVIDASVQIEDGPSYEQKVQFGEDWPSRSLADALTRMGHDEVYEGALHAAVGLLR